MRTQYGPAGDLHITPLDEAQQEDGCLYTVLAYLTEPERCVMRVEYYEDDDQTINPDVTEWAVLIHPTSGNCLEIDGRLWQHERKIDEDEALLLATPPFPHFL